MKINIFPLIVVFIVLMSTGCGNPSATNPPSINVSINKYFVTGTAPGATITSSLNNPFTDNLSVVSLVPASKTTLLTITKTTSTTNPTYSESITSSTAASFNALMAEPALVLNGKGSLKTLPNNANNPFANEQFFRDAETQLIKSGTSFQPVVKATAQGINALGNATPDTVGTVNTFWIAVSGTTTDASISATCLYVGPNVYIYVDNATPNIAATYTGANLLAISNAFDAIYTTDRATFGSEYKPGIDGDNHITILISPQVDGNGVGLLGYFYSRDESSTATHSNKREMFYVVDTASGSASPLWSDASASGPNSKKGYAILAHEFQHMINFYQKGIVRGLSENTWLNEALSMYAMQACGYSLPQNDSITAAQVATYLTWPETTSLTNWVGNNAHYGASYLFMLYLVEHYGGSGILTGMESNALTGIANVESVTGTGTFGIVFKNWVMANYLDHITTNNAYNYTSINLHSTYVTSGGTYILNGAQLATTAVTAYPYNANANQPGWSAMYQQYTNATNALNISIQNNSGYNYLEGVVLVQ